MRYGVCIYMKSFPQEKSLAPRCFLPINNLFPNPLGGTMNFEEYLKSIDNDSPSSQLSETLTSLWWDKKGNWDTAHTIAQNIPTKEGSAVHAYLHREEGVLWNADYWYSRAGRKRPNIPLLEEWKLLVEEMLGLP